MTDMTLPNLVIAGAPKCGTSSLFEWLVAHPEACGSSIKETRYLLDRGSLVFNPAANVHDHGLAGYAAYFGHCDPTRARLIIEATPDYLYQRTAVEVLSRLEPQPKIVFILRKPSERVYSWYQFSRTNRVILDPSVTFRQFVDLLRWADAPIWKRWPHARQGLDESRYIDHLDGWLACFPRSRLNVFLFERMRENERRFMLGIADRLGIDPSFYDDYDFPRKNATVQLRSSALHRGRLWLSRLKPGRLLPEGRLKRLAQRGFRRSYTRLNIEGVGYEVSVEDRTVLAELDREFEPANQRLAETFGLDLSAWQSET